MTPIDVIVARHRSFAFARHTECAGCGRNWPCDVAQLAEDWQQLRRALTQVTDLLEDCCSADLAGPGAVDAIAAARALLAEERVCSHEPNWNPDDPTYGHCERCGVGLARRWANHPDGEVEVRPAEAPARSSTRQAR